MKVHRDLGAERALKALILLLNIDRIPPQDLRVVRSNSSSNAVARIWGVNRILQAGLEIDPMYIIELVEGNFDSLSCHEKLETLLHELAHIPLTLSGYVRPHNRWFKRDLKLWRRRLKKLPLHDLKSICNKL